jgi:hypothetical protein
MNAVVGCCKHDGCRGKRSQGVGGTWESEQWEARRLSTLLGDGHPQTRAHLRRERHWRTRGQRHAGQTHYREARATRRAGIQMPFDDLLSLGIQLSVSVGS